MQERSRRLRVPAAWGREVEWDHPHSQESVNLVGETRVSHTHRFAQTLKQKVHPSSVWALQCGSCQGEGPRQGWAPNPLSRASSAAVEKGHVPSPSADFTPSEASCCWKGSVDLQRASSGRDSVGEWKRKSYLVSPLGPKREQQLFFLREGLNIESLL